MFCSKRKGLVLNSREDLRRAFARILEVSLVPFPSQLFRMTLRVSIRMTGRNFAVSFDIRSRNMMTSWLVTLVSFHPIASFPRGSVNCFRVSLRRFPPGPRELPRSRLPRTVRHAEGRRQALVFFFSALVLTSQRTKEKTSATPSDRRREGGWTCTLVFEDRRIVCCRACWMKMRCLFSLSLWGNRHGDGCRRRLDDDFFVQTCYSSFIDPVLYYPGITWGWG